MSTPWSPLNVKGTKGSVKFVLYVTRKYITPVILPFALSSSILLPLQNFMMLLLPNEVTLKKLPFTAWKPLKVCTSSFFSDFLSEAI